MAAGSTGARLVLCAFIRVFKSGGLLPKYLELQESICPLRDLSWELLSEWQSLWFWWVCRMQQESSSLSESLVLVGSGTFSVSSWAAVPLVFQACCIWIFALNWLSMADNLKLLNWYLIAFASQVLYPSLWFWWAAVPSVFQGDA